MRVAAGLLAALISIAGAAVHGAKAQDWQSGGGDAWTATLQAGRQEGKVVVAGPPQLARPLAEDFKRDTGIELEYLGGSVRDLASRFEREAAAGTPSIDILLSGANELINGMPQGRLEPLKPQFLLPGVTDAKNWRGGKIKWLDNDEQYLFSGSNWIHAWPVVNINLVKAGALTSWKDLLKPEFKGKIVAIDPRSGGPGQAAAAYLASTFGIDFIKQLYQGQEVVNTRDGRQLMDWLVRGNYAVAIGAVQADIEVFRSRGIKNIEVRILPDGPGTQLGGFSVMKQAKNVPHPNAARVFINWYASRPGQIAYSRTMLEPSTRADVDLPEVPDYTKPMPGVTYLDQYQQDWYVNQRPKLEKAVVDALGGR